MWKNIPFKSYFYFSLGLNFASILLILAIRSVLPPIVPLFYGLPVGENQLANSLELLIGPSVGLTISLINLVLARLVKEDLLKRILMLSGAFISLILGIAVVQIILLIHV
jgi:hypothetical protein